MCSTSRLLTSTTAKVVRVNDVDLDIEPIDGHSELRIMAVNVGLAAAVRRLLQGTIAKHRIRADHQAPLRREPFNGNL